MPIPSRMGDFYPPRPLSFVPIARAKALVETLNADAEADPDGTYYVIEQRGPVYGTVATYEEDGFLIGYLT